VSIHVNELERLIRAIFKIDPHSDNPFAPRFHCHSDKTPQKVFPIAQQFALCPGSVLLARLPFNEQFSRAITGIDVEIAFILTTLSGDFVNRNGELRKNYPFFGSAMFFLFFFRCDNAKIEELLECLGAEYNTSSLRLLQYRHSHTMLDTNVMSDDYEVVGKKKRGKKRESH
jgi:hypothetical protein